MEVLVDTSVWSIVLRHSKRKVDNENVASHFSDLINESRVKIIGPIRQEVLSGISDENQYRKLKDYLIAFEDLPISSAVYERAADMFNCCRKKGICGSHIDFLICAVSEYYHLSIFTTDKDFPFYAELLPIFLYKSKL